MFHFEVMGRAGGKRLSSLSVSHMAPKKAKKSPCWRREVLLRHQREFYLAVGDPRAANSLFLLSIVSRMPENTRQRVLDRHRRSARRGLFR